MGRRNKHDVFVIGEEALAETATLPARDCVVPEDPQELESDVLPCLEGPGARRPAVAGGDRHRRRPGRRARPAGALLHRQGRPPAAPRDVGARGPGPATGPACRGPACPGGTAFLPRPRPPAGRRSPTSRPAGRAGLSANPSPQRRLSARRRSRSAPSDPAPAPPPPSPSPPNRRRGLGRCRAIRLRALMAVPAHATRVEAGWRSLRRARHSVARRATWRSSPWPCCRPRHPRDVFSGQAEPSAPQVRAEADAPSEDFALQFARAYLTYDAAHPGRRDRALAPYLGAALGPGAGFEAPLRHAAGPLGSRSPPTSPPSPAAG